jgi:serine phosphatase RsbU (regulator of sigma subunit)/HAMP domain-containing protein
MTGQRRKGPGLAGRIVRVTLLVGAVTVFTAGAVAIFATSQLAEKQVAARDHASLQLVQDEVLGRFSSIESIASQASEEVASQRSTAVLDSRLGPILDASSGLVTRMIVADRSGHVITAFPQSIEASSLVADPAFKDAVMGNTGFSRVQNTDGTWELWLMRTVLTPNGAPALLLLSADSTFLRQAVATAAGDSNRIVTVLEGGRPLLSSATGNPTSLAGANWTPESTAAGRVSATSYGGQAMLGYYSDVRGIQGIAWRVAVLEPSTRVATDTAQAVAPTILVLLLGGVFGVAAALLVSQRLVRPLKALEATAYRAANGSFVQPISADSDDEIGRVATAFNAVALRLNALHDLSQLLASASQLDQVLDGILSAMRHIVGPGVAAIYLLDDDAMWLVPARARGVDVGRARRVAADGEGWLAQALRQADVQVHEADSATVQLHLPGLSDDQTVALAAPLVSGHETLGVIAVLRRANEPVSDAESEMMRTFSAQAAVAVHNSRLFEAETESLRIAEALRTVAERLVRPGGLGPALADVEEVVTDLFDAEGAVFAIVDRAAIGLPPAEDRDLERDLLVFCRRLFAVHGTRALVVHRGDDPDADAALDRLSATSMLISPVALDSEHGAVLVVTLNRTNVPNRDLDLAEAVTNEVALALDNSYLFERALSRAANLETVFRISQAVGSSLQVNVVLNRVLDVVQKILSADAVALMTYDNRKRSISTAMARGAVPPELVTIEIQPGEDVPGYVFSTGEPAAFRDLNESMGGIAGKAAQHNLRSLLAVPLLARGRSIGVLTVFSVEAGAFSDEDMSVLQTFASQAALALDTARLYSREHEVASILQQSILPDALPVYAEIEAASSYQPAGADAEIGGDYYDLFRAPDGAIWFAIADVCGKGVIAATKTSMIKYSVRAFVAAGLAPSAVLGEVNRIVSETGDTSDIVTLWAGRLIPERHELTYASGGHPPAIISHASGGAERTVSTGPLLGALVDVVYGEETLKLEANDVILLYTDGVTEARSGKEFFGEDRVEEALLVGGTPDEIVRRLLTLVRRWVHGELRDDVAVLAIALKADESEHGSAYEGKIG